MTADAPAPRVLTRPIVVGLAEDARTDPVSRMAWDLAQRCESSVEFVHVVPERHLMVGAESDETRQRRVAAVRSTVAARLDAIISGSDESLPSERLEVVSGKPAEVLIERAEAVDAGLMMVGPHRRRGLIDFGSTTRALLTHTPCAVWSQVQPPKPVERILVPVDTSSHSLGAYRLARELARAFEARVTLLSCFLAPEFAYVPDGAGGAPTYVIEDHRRDAREEFERFAEAHGAAGHGDAVQFVEGDPVLTILAMQDSNDLIVMGTQGRGAFSSAVLGSVTYSVLRQADLPVVAVRGTEADETP